MIKPDQLAVSVCPCRPRLGKAGEPLTCRGGFNFMEVWQVASAVKTMLAPRPDSIPGPPSFNNRATNNTSMDPTTEQQVISALKDAYRYHHMGHDHVTSGELSDILMNALCEAIGDKAFQKFLEGFDNE